MKTQKSIKQFNRSKGNAGEAVACRFLEQNGFEIITQNFKAKQGEIDIIASKDNVLHFIEVKYRGGDFYGTGREAVTPTKQKTIRSVAKIYLLENSLYDEVFCCFDVVEISGKINECQIEFLENCF